DAALAQIETLKKQVLDEAAIAAKVAELATALDEARNLAPGIATDGKSADALRRDTLKAVIAADSDGHIKAVATAVLGGKEAAVKACQ
ncbi:MAG: hypothetical protein LBU45_03755, partial [Azoarcus sp.]|nr:hypothetical protein [Azoarcus sp.]